MHRDVRRVRHQAPVRAEQRAGKVQTLLDVGADAGALQRATHLFGDAHEPVVEDGQLHGVGDLGRVFLVLFGRVEDHLGGFLVVFGFLIFDHIHGNLEVAVLGHLGDAAGLDDARRGSVHDHARSLQQGAGSELLQQEHRRLPPSTLKVHPRDGIRVREIPRELPLAKIRDLHALKQRGLANPTHAHVVYEKVPADELEAVLPLEPLAKRPREIAILRLGDHDRRIRALVPEVEENLALALFFAIETLRDELQKATFGEFVRGGSRVRGGWVNSFNSSANHRVRARKRPLRLGDHVRQSHAVRGQDAAKPVNKHRGHAEGSGDGARVLGSGSAKRGEDVRRRVEPFALRDLADGSAHGLVGNLDVSQRHLLDAHLLVRAREAQLPVDLLGLSLERRSRRRRVQGLILVGAKNLGKVLRQDPAQQQVGVRHREVRAAFPVAYRPGLGSNRLRSDPERP